MNNLLFCIRDENNKTLYIEYRYEEAMEFYYNNDNAVRMYAYDKNKLKPTKCLIHWKWYII